MIFTTHELQPPLATYLESIFHFKHFTPDHSIERVVPTGHMFILFALDGMTRNTFDNHSLACNGVFSKVWVSGMQRNFLSISAHQDSEMLVMQFKPYGARPFFHQPIDRYNDQVCPAEEIFGEGILELHSAIEKATETKDKFMLAEQWLLQKYAEQMSPPDELIDLINQLQPQPVMKYQEVINGYSGTQKHLISQFKKHVGLTPKVYQRMLRFNDILAKLHKQEQVKWSEVAYQCGYADQSHFIKEFRHFSGFNPTEFLLQNHHQEAPNFFPLDRTDEP